MELKKITCVIKLSYLYHNLYKIEIGEYKYWITNIIQRKTLQPKDKLMNEN